MAYIAVAKRAQKCDTMATLAIATLAVPVAPRRLC